MRRRYLPRIVRERVAVHTTDGRTIEGILVGEYRDAVVIRHGRYLHEDGAEPLEGDVVIPLERVSMLQAPEPSSAPPPAPWAAP